MLNNVEVYRCGGWVRPELSRELLRCIFPNYPYTSVVNALPEWIKEKLK